MKKMADYDPPRSCIEFSIRDPKKSFNLHAYSCCDRRSAVLVKMMGEILPTISESDMDGRDWSRTQYGAFDDKYISCRNVYSVQEAT